MYWLFLIYKIAHNLLIKFFVQVWLFFTIVSITWNKFWAAICFPFIFKDTFHIELNVVTETVDAMLGEYLQFDSEEN